MAINKLKRATILLLIKAFEREGNTDIMPCSGHKTFHKCTMINFGKVYLFYNVPIDKGYTTHTVSMLVSEVL